MPKITIRQMHRCDYRDPEEHPLDHTGIIVDRCLETVDGNLWIITDGGEETFESRNVVNYCPFCGYKALKPIGKTYPHEEDDS